MTPNELNDGRCKEDIRRIDIAKQNFNDLKSLLTNEKLNLKKRLQLCECYVWSVVCYGCETWTLKGKEIKSLSAFEQWCNGRMLKISWKEKRTNNLIVIVGVEID